jgi:hypothetical protein
MRVPRVTLLYEDSRGPTREFGLHDLVVAAVADATGRSAHDLRRALPALPLNGAAKLLRSCRQDVQDIAADCHPVVAVLDGDKIRRLLGLPAAANEKSVEASIKEGCDCPQKLHVALLDRNLDAVVRAVVAHLGSRIGHDLAREALANNLTARDIVLQKAAYSSEPADRTRILDMVPSLRDLCGRIRDLLSAQSGGAAP